MREKWSNSSIDSDAETEYKLKEPNISIYFFLRPSLNGVLFPMFCLLVDGESDFSV